MYNNVDIELMELERKSDYIRDFMLVFTCIAAFAVGIAISAWTNLETATSDEESQAIMVAFLLLVFALVGLLIADLGKGRLKERIEYIRAGLYSTPENQLKKGF